MQCEMVIWFNLLPIVSSSAANSHFAIQSRGKDRTTGISRAAELLDESHSKRFRFIGKDTVGLTHDTHAQELRAGLREEE